MEDSILIEHAEKYLRSKNIEYIKPGRVGRREAQRIEIIFLKPEALDPNIVVDPPDMWLWVDKATGEVEWIPIM